MLLCCRVSQRGHCSLAMDLLNVPGCKIDKDVIRAVVEANGHTKELVKRLFTLGATTSDADLKRNALLYNDNGL